MGLPLATWDKATYNKVSEFLASELSIPKNWFYDLNTYDAAQLLGGVIGIVATALYWNRADTESFARLVGGMGVSALARTNPLLLLVTVAAVTLANPLLARHIALAHQQRQHRITTQFAMVVEIFISESESIDSLRHQLVHAVFDARRIAVIDEASRHSRRHPGAFVHLA